uniref:non-specific serine/threonine protein kinase n=1 Tax=Guillardia theta TaxID=55529 RepID=A0A7S4UEE0_GUITH|mmetsp:Transcript_44433/g.140209  ORF Transcript_44433/g.140209 Transcript_44433/m.140209 type:complete len:636 (+) Transcript_44433:244-2151(+)
MLLKDEHRRTSSFLELLERTCHSNSVRKSVCEKLCGEGIIAESWTKHASLQRQISEEMDELDGPLDEALDLQEDLSDTIIDGDSSDFLQMEVFNSSAIKNIGRFNCEFIRYDLLGRGGFGSAWRCHNLVDEHDYCVKELHLSASKFAGSVKKMVQFARGVLREVSTLSHIEQHANVVKYNAAWAELETERSGPQKDVAGLDADDENTQLSGGDEDEDDDEELLDNDAAREGGQDSSHLSRNKVDKEQKRRASPVSDSSWNTFTHSSRTQNEISSSDAMNVQDPEVRSQRSSGSSYFSANQAWDEMSADQRRKIVKSLISRTLELVIEKIEHDDIVMNRCVGKAVAEIQADLVQRDVVLYIQMELCHNRTLSHWLDEPSREIVVDRNLQILIHILRGLKHIHELGLCHRDLKPANLLISKDGVIKLADFGLAKSVSPASPGVPPNSSSQGAEWPMSRPKVVGSMHTRGVGTALYAAPEQISGESCDEKSDIYSLGVLLVELFSIFGSGMERILVLTAAREGKLPQGMTEEYPIIAGLAVKCLAKDPEDRPSAQMLLEELSAMGQQASLPPLLELADRTISELTQLLEERDETIKSNASLIASLRSEIADKDKLLLAQEATIAKLKELLAEKSCQQS